MRRGGATRGSILSSSTSTSVSSSMHLSSSLSPSLSVSLFLLHPRLTFPQTPSRVSPPMRPPSPSPPYECQVALPSTATRGCSFGSSFDSSLSFFLLHLARDANLHELTRISHRMGEIVNLDAQKRKEITILCDVQDIYTSCVYKL